MGTDTRPAFFSAMDDLFVPYAIARSPWDGSTMSGVVLAGLLALLVEREVDMVRFSIARLTIDILGPAARVACRGRVTIRREGRQQRLIEAEVLVDDRVVARASALAIRRASSPSVGGTLRWQLPETLPVSRPSALRPYLERRIVYGAQDRPGRGAMWVRLDVNLVEGTPLSPLCHAAMFADFGSGIGSSLALADWTFANVDVSLHLIRLPVDEWLLIEADSDSDGDGKSLVTSIFADRAGIFAHGHQTLFVAPRPAQGATDIHRPSAAARSKASTTAST